jgi:hypothetical protein
MSRPNDDHAEAAETEEAYTEELLWMREVYPYPGGEDDIEDDD